ncbi:hypothetical protein [Streptomyces sp. NRRL S-646]|uniref:hypothetical protein n=1 Tax=Streptomyces sp. NRRL S-646 TaxID=1463917 RepID=UPI000B28B499|nr:hypothetical protein [Streptomyces sp. NRRL S-646]
MPFPSLPLPVLCTGVLVFVAVYGGVVLPAVWSRRPARRNAAFRVLAELLGALRNRRKP